MRTHIAWTLALGLVLLAPDLPGPAPLATADTDVDVPKSDERVVFFPTAAHRDAKTGRWHVPIHGWIFEPETESVWRRAVTDRVRRALDVPAGSPAAARLSERLGPFLADNERGKRLAIALAGETFALAPSAPNGHFLDVVRIAPEAVETHASGGLLRGAAVTGAGDARRFPLHVHLVAPEGLSVVSDLDDTIKVSEVADKAALLRNTFVEPYRAVDGMAKAYRRWAREGAAFHYVSDSPWQLYPALSAFLQEAGFPDGSFHLASLRFEDESFLDRFDEDRKRKEPVIRALLARYPGRRFVFVGDSGESDPEIYGRVARAHPDQVLHVAIRAVAGADGGDERFAAAFRGLAEGAWTVFEDPERLPAPDEPARTEAPR